MRETYTEIAFGLIDTTAKGDGVFSSNGKQSFVDLDQLEDSGTTPTPIFSCEKNQTILNGTHELVNPNTLQEYGYWSLGISDEDGDFTTNPVLTKTFTQYHTTAGLTLTFGGDSLPQSVTITYYQDNSILDTFTHVVDRFNIILDDLAENYNKIQIEFVGMTIPSRYVKLTEIVWGVGKSWAKAEIIKANLLEEVNLTSDEVSTNELEFSVYDRNNDFNILNPEGVYTALQERQELTVTEYFNGTPVNMGKFYLSEWDSTVNKVAHFKANDMLGLLDNTTFRQFAIWSNKTASSIFSDIFAQANITDYNVDNAVASRTLNGYVPLVSIREALQQVCFALRCSIYCDRDGVIQIKDIDIGTSNYIDKSAKLNTKLTQEPLINSVVVNAYNFTLGSSEELYKETLTAGTYEVEVEPSGVKTITGGTISQQGLNYVIIVVGSTGEVVISGAKYVSNVSMYTKRALVYNDLQQVEVKDIYCISKSNGQAVADYVYNDYQRRLTQEFTLLVEDEKIGDTVDVEIENTTRQGIITKLDIDLTGGYKGECTVRGGISG